MFFIKLEKSYFMNLKNYLKNKKCNYGLMAFLSGLGLALLLFVPSIIYDNGYFTFYGDFNAQQLPFYQMIHDSIRNGDTMWSSTTDLGANLIGSYSFYLIGSPFFWITLLFPSSAVPYLMAPLLILKFGFSSLTAYLYLKRYVNDRRFAVLGGLMYAFSGFSLYNVFFNHFHEAIIVFPLLLFAVDEYMYSKRKVIMGLCVFASCVMNYYFFVGQVVFVIIYWIIRVATKSYPKLKFKELIYLATEVILGFLMTAVILIPSVLSVIQNNRVSTWPDGWGAVVYDVEQRYVHIIESFFFPPDISSYPNFTPGSDSKWASLGAWLPLVGMTGVIGFLQTNGKHWLKKVIPLLFVMALVPIFNAMFQGLNMNYYARWFYILELMMILATVRAFENKDVDWLKATRLSAGITAVILVLIGVMPYSDYSQNEQNPTTKLGLESNAENLWIYGAIALTSLCVFAFLIKAFIKNKDKFVKFTAIGLSLTIVVYGNYIFCLCRSHGTDSRDFLLNYGINARDNIDIEDIDNVRSDFYSCEDNLGMYWQITNIQAFHSIVPGSIMDFYPELDITRDVASRPDTDSYALRSFLSVKYLFDNPANENNFYSNETYKMPGWSYYDDQNGVEIFENNYYIPMGFMYDDFICEEEFKTISTKDRDKALLKAMVLSKKQIKKYSEITNYVEGEFDLLEDEISAMNYQGISADFEYGVSDYYKDCNNRKGQSCQKFQYINNGFTAEINNTGEDNLLFFSVPYEEGWTAYVNGEKAEIEKANIGFMAVKINGHANNKIKFVYNTPGLGLGFGISIISAFLFIGYLSVTYYIKRKKSSK